MRRPTSHTFPQEKVTSTAVLAGLIAFTASTATYVAVLGPPTRQLTLQAASGPLTPAVPPRGVGAQPVKVDPHPAPTSRRLSSPPAMVVSEQVSRSADRAPLVTTPSPPAPAWLAAATAARAAVARAAVPVAPALPATAPAPAPVLAPVTAMALPPSGGQGVAPSGLGAQAVAIAAQQNGSPYVYGGASPGGFDCSGLTSYVYGRLGRYLPHNSDAQYAAVAHIPVADMIPGDLIFFGSPGAVYHVGIYAGNNMLWHAPSPGDVVRLAPIWTDAYLAGRP